MRAIELYSAKNAGYTVRLSARTNDQSGLVEAVVIATEVGGAAVGSAEFKLKPPFDLPNVLVKDGKLQSWSDLRGEIEQLRKNGETAKAAEREKARDALRAKLAASDVDVATGAGGYLGIDSVGFVNGTATAIARLAIDWPALLPDLKPDDAVVLSASLSVTGKAQLVNKDCEASLRLDVVVTRAGLIGAIPSLSLDPPPLIKLPPFHFHWPKIDWPKLKWPDLDLLGLASLLRFDLPIPKIGNLSQPLRVVWSDKPTIAFGLDAQRLTLATSHPGKGDLVYDNGRDAAVKIAGIDNLALGLSPAGVFSLIGSIKSGNETIKLPRQTVDQPEALPFAIEIDEGSININIAANIDLAQATAVDITAKLDLPRILFRAKSDSSLVLAVHAAYRQTYTGSTGAFEGKLTTLEIVEPYPVALIARAARETADAAQALIRWIAAIPVPNAPDTGLGAVLERIAAMAGAAVKWLVHQAGGLAETLLGVAEAVGRGLEESVSYLHKTLATTPGAAPHLALEIRLDSRSYALRQIVVSPAWKTTPAAKLEGEALGLQISVPMDWRPSLLIDLDGPPSVALIALQGQKKDKLTLATDLWLTRDAGIEAVRDTDKDGKRPQKGLIEASVSLKSDGPISIFRYCGGKARFLEQIRLSVTPLTENGVDIASLSGPVLYEDIDPDALNITGAVDPDGAERLLPFLQSPKGNAGDGILDNLDQYIKVKRKALEIKGREINLVLDAELHISTADVSFPLTLTLDIATFDIRLSGPQEINIEGEKDNHFDIFGLTGKIVETAAPETANLPGKINFFKLDFSKGDVRLSLAANARLELAYGRVASSGRGLVFLVDEFGLSRSGLDLNAGIDPKSPVQLAGVDMPFRFLSGGLAIKSSQIQSFMIAGAGQLPPELVGEANAKVSITLGRGTDGALIVQSADATLDKSKDPIVCHGTRFTLTLTAIGFELKDFSADGAGYHFYFTLTGTAQFKPRPGEFTDGLLKNFGSLTITLDKAPLARDPTMLLKAIEFQVAVEPKKRINFFNLFTFELRGIGFHPKSPAFDGAPAMSVSGQVNFVEAGDIVSPRFDFHELWIAPPPKGDWRPRVRFDGLTVGVRFGGAASIEGTAIAVDDKLPTLFTPGALPANVTAHGFLASGKLTIKGWGQMAASMGFLELQKAGGEVRQAFFLYGQAGELSIEIPTPLGPIYLREVGFGFGFRYTLAAFNRADQVQSVGKLIEVLDGISKYQGELASVTAWEPEAEGNRLTLALRGLISIASASGENEYNAKAEKDLANPILFDIVAALRSDFTFFMNARVWVCRNYADWHDSSATSDSWRTNPTLRGYVYLSVPRKEFLGRLIADGKGDVEGKHPELPAPLMQAMKNVRWSATTYIRPGLFHQEFGWPYELGFTFEKGNFLRIDCQGGLVNRIEDGAMLYGIAFRAKGFAQIGGSIGGRSFGASVIARADFSLDAKYIAYFSLKRFSDSLFYGSLAFDATISLQVRVWLEFSLGFTDVHLEVGFSLSLTISVALEIAVSPNSIGGRASASVGVGAFGRSLRLGVGFGFNEGAVDAARSRVARFLALGLTVATPDPAQGVAPPAPEQPRGPASHNADQALDHGLDKHDAVSPPADPNKPAEAAKGRDLQPSRYWAMLFPVTGDAGKAGDDPYLMIFVPRDHTDTGVPALREPDSSEPLGTFYPPPYDALGDSKTLLKFDNVKLKAPVTVTQLTSNQAPKDVLFDANLELSCAFEAPVASNDGKVLTLRDFLAQCFVRRSKEHRFDALGEPEARPVDSGRERLPDSREAAAQALADAGREQLALEVEHRAARDIEERRSAAVASLCEAAARLASGGEPAWKVDPPEGLDPRQFGVAFVVKGADLDILFNPGIGPRAANFELVASDDKIGKPQEGPTVHLFNPPERMFRQQGPRLAEPTLEVTPAGVRLDWDLEPAFGASQGAWDDPEYNLKHYRVERVVMKDEIEQAPYPPRRVTVKAAAPMRLVRDPVTGDYVWRFLRPNAQYVDDLSDLPADDRAALLPGGQAPTRPQSAILRYVVTPVDTAGTEGPPTPLQIAIKPQVRPREPVRRAELHFEYRGEAGRLRDPFAAPVAPTAKLGLQDARDDKPSSTAKRTYRLRVRRERGAASGLYGADAVTDALARPTAGDFALKQIDDVDFELTHAGTEVPEIGTPLTLGDDKGYAIASAKRSDNAGALAEFMAAIGVATPGEARLKEGPRGVRFAIRPKPGDGEADAPWTPVDVTMLIDPSRDDKPSAPGETQKPKPPPVAAPVEIFEHPVAVDAAPLLGDDLDGEAGRVLVWHPRRDGSLAALLEPDGKDLPLLRLRDPERRVATRVRWNGRPARADGSGAYDPQGLARFFGGFDLFEIDAAGEAEGASSAPAAVAISYKFSAATAEGDPGPGLLRLNEGEEQRNATALYVDLQDAPRQDCAERLDAMDDTGERPKGQLRLVKASDPSHWIAFDLIAAVRTPGYRKLIVAGVDASEAKPFADHDDLVLSFTRISARHVARLQALPKNLAMLDPAEIADFAKIEAHYPSETLRLQKKRTARRAPWFSPAESFVVWPERTLRRALSINVDEAALTELLSHGRPTHIEARLEVGEIVRAVMRYPDHDGPFVAPEGRWDAASLRALLQELIWDQTKELVLSKDPNNPGWVKNDKPTYPNAKKHYDARPGDFRAARVVVAACLENKDYPAPGLMLASVDWPIDLDPTPHPVLVDAIDRARYAQTPVSGRPPLRLGGVESLRPSDFEACESVVFDFAGWPKATKAPNLRFLPDGKVASALTLTFSAAARAAKKQFQRLQAALPRLAVAAANKELAALAKDYNDAPRTYDAVRLRLTCTAGGATFKQELPVEFDSILGETRTRSVYRRYEPVLEPLPKTNAADVPAWVEETPAERDPYGWGVLRTLGLAIGLRLYDTEKRDYVKPRDALALLNKAFQETLEWYADADLGAAFVDVVTRAGGSMSLASFDGGTPAAVRKDVDNLLDHDALALTQLSLRPVANRWSGKAQDRPVAYYLVYRLRGANPPDKVTIDLAAVAPKDGLAAADVLDLTTGLARAALTTVTTPVADADEARRAMRDALNDRAGALSGLTIDVSRIAPGGLAAIVRATVTSGDAAKLFAGAWVVDGKPDLADELILEDDVVTPFGRFDDMAAERFGLIASKHGTVNATIRTLRAYAERRWPEGWPKDAALSALIARLPNWTRRFLDHGAGERPAPRPHFALAEVTRPDPWRVALQDDGTMEALLTHDDRKRRLKRYAVRPFGRYEAYVEALHSADPAASPQPPRLTGAWSAAAPPADLPGLFSQRLLDIVIPRTEPVAPPVLVGARRIDVEDNRRSALEFLYKRHPEEILSEANITAEGVLSFETVSVGFWREFPMQRWANDLAPGIETVEAFGGWDHNPEALTLIERPGRFGGLESRYADGWQGALALRTASLPFFFRMHAAAFASAGVVVSDPVVATVEEGHYELHLPWKQEKFKWKTHASTWSAELGKDGVYVKLQLPLARFVDEMTAESIATWLSIGNTPKVFTLPDPLVRYEIRTVATDESGLTSASPELDVVGLQWLEAKDEKDRPAASKYQLNLVGPLFARDSASVVSLDPPKDDFQWTLNFKARVNRSEDLPQESFAPILGQFGDIRESPLTLFELETGAFADGHIWRQIAPQAQAEVKVRAVANTNPGFQQFKDEVGQWRDAFAGYAAHPPAKKILDFLQSWVDTDGVSPPPASLRVDGFAAGLPNLGIGLPAAVAIALGPFGSWSKPAKAGIAEREELRGYKVVQGRSNFRDKDFASLVAAPARREMRRLVAMRKAAEPRNRHPTFPPYLEPVRSELAAAALAAGAKLPDSAGVIAAAEIEIQLPQDANSLVDLIGALEAAPFTATAIADVGPLEDGAKKAVAHLPCTALADAKVVAALNSLSKPPGPWQAVSLQLRAPPIDDDRKTIFAAIDKNAALWKAFENAMASQIFGVGRKPEVKAFRGVADPDSDPIQRPPVEVNP